VQNGRDGTDGRLYKYSATGGLHGGAIKTSDEKTPDDVRYGSVGCSVTVVMGSNRKSIRVAIS